MKTKVKSKNLVTCDICNATFLDWGMGHNPDPVLSEGRCCGDCNRRYVIPMRMLEDERDTTSAKYRELMRMIQLATAWKRK